MDFYFSDSRLLSLKNKLSRQAGRQACKHQHNKDLIRGVLIISTHPSPVNLCLSHTELPGSLRAPGPKARYRTENRAGVLLIFGLCSPCLKDTGSVRYFTCIRHVDSRAVPLRGSVRDHRSVGSYWPHTGPGQVLRDPHGPRMDDRTGVPKPVEVHARVRHGYDIYPRAPYGTRRVHVRVLAILAVHP